MANIIEMIKRIKEFLDLENRVVGINARNRQLIYPNNPRKDFPLANDKSLTKKFLEELNIPIPPTYAIISEVGRIEETWKQMTQYNALAIKPANGKGGGGIIVLKQIENEWYSFSGRHYSYNKIIRHIANILFGIYSFGSKDTVIIEYCIQPPEFFTAIYQKGVPDVRIINYQGIPILAMMRYPTNQSDGKANLHQGAIGIAVDIKTGILGMGYNYKGYISRHPDTDFVFEGLTVPYWQKMLDISILVSKHFPLKYNGIDIVVDKDMGPVIMELNARPGIEIQNVTQKGLKEIIENLNL
ncbi:MAG TPA: alpha-L-glutamate ligase-like protein [Bacteroidales bacterium]|nr:alpha-L-glutamate ligase-like protein [Bacteroidales bacterium]